MSCGTILILAALQLEARCIAKSLGVRPMPAGSGLPAGDLPPVLIYTIGIRASRLPADLLTSERFTSAHFRCVVLAGLGGGLDPSLQTGDLVVDCDVGFGPSPCGRCAIHGRIHCAPEVVSTRDDKAALFKTTQAIAVEMEADAVRHAIAGRDVPFIGIRAISDTADISLPAAIARWVDPIGRPRPLAIASGLVRQPTLLADARRLQKDTAKALASLGEGVRHLVKGLTS